MGIQIISYRCHLKNRMGRTISSTIVRDVILDPEGGDFPLKGLSKALIGIKKDEVREIFLRAQDAYGLYDPNLVITRFLDDAELEFPLEMDERVLVVRDGVKTKMRVVEFSSDTVTLDGNHPLAGQDLVFEIHALDARNATSDEILDAPKGQPFLH
jgi:FKBP-type peptidyl-prolyl cis-trans isomerase SlyD